MVSIQSKVTHGSKVMPGVTFVVRTLNKIQRARRDFPIADHVYEYQEAFGEALRLLPDGFLKISTDTPEGIKARIAALAAMEPATARARSMADYRAELIENEHLKPAYIRAGLVSITGAEIDGIPVTPDTLLESSADFDALIDEIYDACREASGLTAAQVKNSESPTTGPAQVATETSGTSADPASV